MVSAGIRKTAVRSQGNDPRVGIDVGTVRIGALLRGNQGETGHRNCRSTNNHAGATDTRGAAARVDLGEGASLCSSVCARIVATYRQEESNVSRAARRLGISRNAVYRLRT